MGTNKPDQVLLKDAVATIEQMVSDKEHGDRGHVSHYLFALRAGHHEACYEALMCITGLAFSFYYCLAGQVVDVGRV